MAEVWKHRRAIAAALFALASLVYSLALAQDRGPKETTDLYDRPTLTIDPGMYTTAIRAQAVDGAGRFAVTGGADRTVRIWSVADGKLLRTIRIPVGPEDVGLIYAVAISPDGSTIAAGGWTESLQAPFPIYLFDRETGNLVRRIGGDLPDVTLHLTFSPDSRYLAATLGGANGLRVFDRDKHWSEAFRDEEYRNSSYGAAFAAAGRLATSALDGFIRLYQYDPKGENPNFRLADEPAMTSSGHRPWQIAFNRDGKRLAVGYNDVGAVDILDGTTLNRIGGQRPADVLGTTGLAKVAWSTDGLMLFGAGAAFDFERAVSPFRLGPRRPGPGAAHDILRFRRRRGDRRLARTANPHRFDALLPRPSGFRR